VLLELDPVEPSTSRLSQFRSTFYVRHTAPPAHPHELTGLAAVPRLP
jgi:hypothetical protein